jgi:putative oxidoreductase
MQPVLGRYADTLYAILRIIAGLLFACHGAQKLFGVLGGTRVTGNNLMMLAGIIEFVGGLMIALGLLASIAAFIASGQMAVAYFMVHAKGGLFPIVNKGELAVIYCFVFLFIAARGSGPLSLDRTRGKR